MIRFFAGHPTAANLLMFLLFAAGLVSLAELRRETFPEFALDVVQVSVPYPGASAEMVEEAICQRIEEALEVLTDVDEMRCEAREGIGRATIEMVQGADVNRFLTDVKAEIDAIDDFPELAEQPLIKQLERTDIVVSIAIAGPMAERDLKVFAEEVKERALRQGVASRVDLLGFSQRQLRIEVVPEALRQYGLSVADVADAVSRQSLDLPSGLIETGERDILVRFADRRQAPLPFEDLVILGGSAGAELRLGQIARITDRFERDEERVYLNGQRAALLQINKTRAEDTLAVMERVRAFVDDERRRAPPGVEFELTRDIASIVQDRLDMLLNNGMMGLGLVFLVLWLFFSFRFSFWVAMGLPATFLGSIAVLVLIDYSINMLTMVALLIAIGLIMDDAIVIAENVARHRRMGKTPLAAAVEGTREVAAGVVSSFVTTVCIFAPLAFLEGDIGRAMRVVPVVLIITLAVSLVEAFLILPHHVSHAMKDAQPGRFRRRFDAGFDRVRENGLGRLVDTAVRWRYLTVGLIVMAFLGSVSMVAGGHVKFRAFPELDGDVIEARLLLPQGTPLARTEAAVEKVVAALHRVDDAFTPLQPEGQRLVRNVLIQFSRNVDAFETGPHVATVTADLLRAEAREGRIADYLGLWRQEVGPIPDMLSMTFTEPQIGPAGIPIEFRLQGDDLDTLKAASRDLATWLARYPGVTDLQDDLRPGKPELRLRLREGAVAAGLDAASVARQLRAALHGITADEIQVGRERFEIDVRLDAAGRASIGALDDFPVFLPSGKQTPLTAVAMIEEYRGYARINRIDRLRTVTLRGDLDAEVANLGEIVSDTRARFLPELERRYPDIRISLEGETARQRETGESIRRALVVGLIGIFVLLSFQFRSYLEPITVMAAIPLAVIGVIWGHVLMGLDLSMPSALGAVSLAGIVVNDSILLVLFVKRNAQGGRSVIDAARQASRDRFRPVLLTSLTTIAGVAPLLFERSLQAQVLVPLVTSLAFGLLASTILVLILLPALYAVFHDFGLTELAKRRRQADTPAEATS
ncbi:MAG: efflux RND transporter permease subunit [Rhodospirillales bacterium]|nr:MAG: efflux RND transporter permease subunit [Rhodospirillales bacterium]